MSKNYSRRNVIEMGLGSLAGLSLLDLVGCADATATSSTPQGPAALQMFFWGSTTRDKLTRQAITLFQQKYPNITISSQYAGFDTYWNRLNAQIAGGKAPDLIQMDMRYLAHYVRTAQLLDLNQLIYSQTIDLSDYDPALLDSSKANNTVYGIPMGGNYQCMFYDKLLLAKAAVGPFTEDMTWDTFAQYTAEITKSFGNGVYGSSDNSGDIVAFEIWIRQRNKELYNRDGNLAFDVADVTDWFTYWSEMRKSGACVPIDVQTKLDGVAGPQTSTIVNGKAVFNFSFSNLFESYQKAMTHPLAMVTFPKGPTPGMYLKASMLLSISAQSKYPTQAASFIDFINNDEQGVKALGIERGIPGSIQARTLLNPQLSPAEQATAAYNDMVARGNATRVKEVLDPPAAGQVSDALKHAAQDVGFKRKALADGVKAFYAAAQKAVTQS